jgi:hypothetical protein
VDKSAALNEGLAISPADSTHCFPFAGAIKNEPRSTDAGLVCPKTGPVYGVWGQLGHLRDSFWVAAMIVCSVVSNNSST